MHWSKESPEKPKIATIVKDSNNPYQTNEATKYSLDIPKKIFEGELWWLKKTKVSSVGIHKLDEETYGAKIVAESGKVGRIVVTNPEIIALFEDIQKGNPDILEIEIEYHEKGGNSHPSLISYSK